MKLTPSFSSIAKSFQKTINKLDALVVTNHKVIDKQLVIRNKAAAKIVDARDESVRADNMARNIEKLLGN